MTELQWLSRLFLGVVFVISGSVKFFAWIKFRDTLSAMEIFPRWLTSGIAWLLPPLEIAVGIAVVIGWRLSVSGPLLLILVLCFLLVLALYRLRGGKDLVCGCFGDFERKTTTASLILRNILLLASGLPLLIPQSQSLANRGLEEWIIASTVVLGVLLAWLLLSRLVETVLLLRAEGRADN